MSKYTEAELKDACLARADYEIQVSMIKDLVALPFEKWWAVYKMKPLIFKPAKKIIDLIPLLESGIDCEFSDKDHTHVDAIGVLGAIDHRVSPNKHPYVNKVDGTGYRHCRPRMNHKMCHDGSKPIEGFVVKVYFDSVDFTVVNTSDNSCWWPHVRAIEYLEVEDDYAYSWEQKK